MNKNKHQRAQKCHTKSTMTAVCSRRAEKENRALMYKPDHPFTCSDFFSDLHMSVMTTKVPQVSYYLGLQKIFSQICKHKVYQKKKNNYLIL